MLPHTSARKYVRYLIVLVSLLITVPCQSIAFGQQIDWEVINAFPFFKDERTFAELRKVYADLDGEKTARQLETILQRQDEEEVLQKRGKDFDVCIAEHRTEDECKVKLRLPYLGWMARLSTKKHTDSTCWDSSALKFLKTADCRGYPMIAPTRRIRAWVEALPAGSNAEPKWFRNGSTFEYDNCESGSARRYCIEFEQVPEVTFELSFERDGYPPISSGPQKIDERLVVGLGDSFGSGEGSPDRPAQFMKNESDRDFFWFWKWRRLPRRDLVDPSDHNRAVDVEWLDRRCHRSMYSYQFKTALHLALRNPRSVVTFVSFSCSGAVTDNIIDKEQSPQESMLRTDAYKGKGKVIPQLQALNKVIGDRAIDLLLLSTGGNDLGFAEYVASVVLSGKTRWIAGVFKSTKYPTPNTKNEIKTTLTNNYRKLQASLMGHDTLRIKGANVSERSRRVLLMSYPNVLRDENGKVCQVQRHEFTIPFNKDSGRAARVERLLNDFLEPLRSFQLDLDSVGLGWTIINDDDDLWRGRGFCSQKDPGNNISDRFIMPQRRNWKWNAYRPKGNLEIGKDEFQPWEYKIYGSRTRWVRLPIDSKLSSDQRSYLWRFTNDWLFKDDRSSVMHPTAEAHAAVADMNLKKIDSLFGY